MDLITEEAIKELRDENKALRIQVRNAERRLADREQIIDQLTTASKNAAQMSSYMEQEILQREKYLNLLLDNCKDFFILLDENLQIVYCSRNFINFMYQINIKNLRGQNFVDIIEHFAGSPYRKGVAARLAILRDGNVSPDGMEEIDVLSDGNSEKYTAFTAPMYGEHHEFNGVLVCYTNVTALVAAREAAEQSARAKSVFLARMSHEIRTPMNAIIGLSKLSLREELEPKVRSYCKDVNSAANNLLGIINDVLDFSKIDSGKIEIAAAEYQFASLINDVIRIIRMRLEDVPVRFVTDIGRDIPGRLIGDEVRIRQILLNLLSNAVKYTNEGQITFVMRAVIGKDGNVTLIATVIDTGIGIKEADQKKLFGDFTRIDSGKTRNVEGSGLGLVIAQSLCRAMGGDVSVKSEYGTGSTFTAIIPQMAEDFTPFIPASDLNADNKREDAFVRFVAPDARLLIVDDISMNLRVVEGLVSPYKTQVDTASSGMAAIKMVKSHEYDIVFMDHMMPEMDGIEAAGHIRKWEQEQREQGAERKAVPIIALTANAITGMREMFLSEGFNDYLSKPIEIPKLDEILAKWIPKEKRQKTQVKPQDDLLKETDAVNALIIPGVDVKKGITMTGGTIAGYRAVLSVFQMDAENRLGFFAAPPAEGKLAVLTMQAHALKSAAATIGATELSRRAAGLEAAGKAGNRAVIEFELAPFLEQLKETVKNIREACTNAQTAEAENSVKTGEDDGKTPPDQAGPSLFVSKLTELKTALELKNMKEIDRLLAEMENTFLELEWAETVSRISTHILMSEFEEALLLIDEALTP